MSTPVSLPSGSPVALTEGQGSSQRQAALSISPLPLPSAPCSSLPESPCLCPALSPSPSPFSSESGSHPAFPYISQQQEVVLAPWGWKPQEAALPLKASLFPVFLHLVSIPFIQTPLASPGPLLPARTRETQSYGSDRVTWVCFSQAPGGPPWRGASFVIPYWDLPAFPSLPTNSGPPNQS